MGSEDAFIIFPELVSQALVVLCELLVGAFELKVVVNLVVLGVDPAGYFVHKTRGDGVVVSVVMHYKVNTKYLQNQ